MKKIFTSMAGGPLAIPALLILPVLFAIFIGIGFTRDDIIEDDVYAIWASEKSDYYQDAKYARSVGRKAGASSLLAIATSRDGGNLMTASRLDEIRNRMEAMESVTVSTVTVVLLFISMLALLFLQSSFNHQSTGVSASCENVKMDEFSHYFFHLSRLAQITGCVNPAISFGHPVV